MKSKTLISLNIVNKEKANVYIILPNIAIMTIDIINLCLEFLNKFEKIVWMCTNFEYSFYNLIISKSPALLKYQDRIKIEIINSSKFIEIQTKESIIISLSDSFSHPDTNKKALLCSPKPDSDILFKQSQDCSSIPEKTFLRNLLGFMQISESNVVKSIDISPDNILKSSSIVSGMIDKKYHVIVMNNFISSIKIVNYLRKHKLKKQLIIISNNKINVCDVNLFYFKDYNFLDFLALELQAQTIYCSAADVYKKALRCMNLNITFLAVHKDFKLILDEITET